MFQDSAWRSSCGFSAGREIAAAASICGGAVDGCVAECVPGIAHQNTHGNAHGFTLLVLGQDENRIATACHSDTLLRLRPRPETHAFGAP